MDTMFARILAECRQQADESGRPLHVILHDCVRERIRFGFTTAFETVNPESTLAKGRGHCNAQGDLFRALLEASGYDAHLRFVRLPKATLRHAVPAAIHACLPRELFHAVTAVALDGRWVYCDSYLFQTAMFARQQNKLRTSGLIRGYGLGPEARSTWIGPENSFSQACEADLRPDDPVYPSLEAAMRDRAGNNRLFGLHFNQWLGLIPSPATRLFERYLNGRLQGHLMDQA